MEAGNRLNIAFVETTLNESMLAEVGDLDTTSVDDSMRHDFRCSTPVFGIDDEKPEKPSFDASCNVTGLDDAVVGDMCDAMADIDVKSK